MRLGYVPVAGGGNPLLNPPIAHFAYDYGIDTVWINSPFSFVNTSTGDSANYWDIYDHNNVQVPGTRTCIPTYSCYLSTTSRSFRYTFTDTGVYYVKLVTRNRTGRDSLTKKIYVGYPSRKPVANFFLDKQIAGVSEWVPAYDITENGPTSWSWSVSPDCRTCATDINAAPNDFLPSSSAQLPVLRARDPGRFDVCLKVSNNVGSDSICKKDYINVIGGLSMCANSATVYSSQPEGYVYDPGGPNQNYFPNIMGMCNFTIDPCASQVTAYLERFRLRSQDSVIFRNGGPTGPIIRTLGGGNLHDTLRTLQASSGRLYLEWKLGSPISNVGDSGLVIRWTSVPATYSKPHAYFTSPDTVYSGQKVNYVNQSTGDGLLYYTWDANGDNIYNDFTTGSGANFTFTTVALIYRTVCVRVSNCKGEDTYCKTLVIMPVQSRPIAFFTSPRPAGFTTDTFRLNDISRNGPNQWEWIITPKNLLYVYGTDSSSQHPAFVLTAPGKYTVRLKARNVFGIDSTEIVQYLEVLAYNSPNTDFPIPTSSDVGITRVQFADVDTTTGLKTPVYDPLHFRKRGVLYRGVSYKLDISRPTGLTPMERKAWIDYNLDADFIDAGEEIFSESNGTNPVGTVTFMIPNSISPGRVTRLRIGVSEGGTTLTPDKARSGCFEDYGIEIGLDGIRPTIELSGPSVYRVQRNTSYQDPGVLAIDNREGDISSRREWSHNIDMSTVGVYKARYWVKDLYGNISDTIERTIQVEINQVGPSIDLIGSDTVYVEVKTGYQDLGATAQNNVGDDITDRMSRIGIVDTAQLGLYVITYSVKDEFGFTAEKNRYVYVVDIQAPTLVTVSGTGIIKHQINTPYPDGTGVSMKDNYFPLDQLTLTRTGTVNTTVPGSYLLQYVGCDPLGNCSPILLVQVDVQDTIPPRVNLLGENPLIVDVYDEDFDRPGINTTDNYDQQSSLISIEEDNIDVNTLGTYQIVYRVKDGSGNETRITREVKVVDRIAPVIEVLGSNPFDMRRYEDYTEPGYRINDNYDDEADLKTKVVITTDLGTRNDTLWADLGGWKYVRYQVKDNSGNLSAVAERTIRVLTIGLTDVVSGSGLSVYPNPSTGVFTIRFTDPLTGPATVTMYNMLGAKVYDRSVADAAGRTEEVVQTTGLVAGVYLLQVTSNGKQFIQRVTVK